MPLPITAMKVLRKRMPRGFRATAIADLSKLGRNITVNRISQMFTDGSMDSQTLKVLARIAAKNERLLMNMSLKARGIKKASVARPIPSKN